MSSALLAALFAILGMGLAGTSAACVVLWRRVRALTLDSGQPLAKSPAARDGSVSIPARPVEKKPTEALAERRSGQAGRRTGSARHPGAGGSTGEGRGVGDDLLRPPVPDRLGLDPPDQAAARRVGDLGRADPDLGARPGRPPGSTLGGGGRARPPVRPGLGDGRLEGMAVDEIARESGYPIGQVELILGLRRRLLVAEAGPDA